MQVLHPAFRKQCPIKQFEFDLTDYSDSELLCHDGTLNKQEALPQEKCQQDQKPSEEESVCENKESEFSDSDDCSLPEDCDEEMLMREVERLWGPGSGMDDLMESFGGIRDSLRVKHTKNSTFKKPQQQQEKPAVEPQ